MSKAKTVQGKDLMIFTADESNVYHAMALSTGCTLEISVEVKETSSKDDGGWTEKILGKFSWNASSDNNYSADEDINGYDELMEVMVSRKPVKLCFGIASNAAIELPEGGWLEPGKRYEGDAYITKLSLNAPNGDVATFNATFDGTGKIAKTSKAAG